MSGMTSALDNVKEKCMPVSGSVSWDLSGASLCIKELTVDGVDVRLGIVRVNKLDSKIVRELASLKNYYGLDVLAVDVHEARDTGEMGSVRELLSLLGIKLVSLPPEHAGETRVRSLVVRTQINSRDAARIFTTKVKNQIAGFMGSLAGRKVEFMGLEHAYMPFRCYNILYNRRFGGGGDLAATEAEYCFELATGSLVTLEDDEIVVTSFMELGELDEIVITAYEYIGRKGEASIDELAEVLGSADRAEIVVRMLVDYGLLEPVGLNTYVPRGPDETSNMVRYFLGKGLAVEGRPPRCSRILGPGVDTEILDRIVRVWGVVRQVWDLYLPVYVGVFKKKQKGREGVEIAAIIDAVWGNRLEDLEELIGSSSIIYIIDEIINEIIEGKARKPEECEKREVAQGGGEG
ncbi:MAG: hypothetical protein F7C34_02120 [Desulfurococcales archaeon]|nr:hypothetical protein [Desulfurococcales archaeon]